MHGGAGGDAAVAGLADSLWAAGLAALFAAHAADGFAQRLTPYQSGNLRRLVTGMLFGFALIGLLAVSTVYVAQLGYRIGKGLAG